MRICRSWREKTTARVTYDFMDSDNAFVHSGPRILSLAAAGQFIPLPNVTNSWHRLGADVQYFFVPRVGVGVDYWYERFNVRDFDTIDIPDSRARRASTISARSRRDTQPSIQREHGVRSPAISVLSAARAQEGAPLAALRTKHVQITPSFLMPHRCRAPRVCGCQLASAT
jgi:hypothetical protein